MRLDRARLRVLLPLLVSFLWSVFFAAVPTPARAAELVIGLGAEVTSLDPHFHLLLPNNLVRSHIFDALTKPDEHRRPGPGLAVDWKPVGGTAWDFTLRRGVLFHDGTPFTAVDAAASLRRALTVQGSPYPYSSILRSVAGVEVVDDHTLRIRTKVPDATIPAAVGQIAVIPARLAQATRANFDGGAAVIGTGPFRFAASRGLAEITLTANPGYWGGRASWDGVTLRVIPSAVERVAALLAGAVHIIDQVPPADVLRLHGEPRITVRTGLSARLIYLALDGGRGNSPFVTGRDGRPLAVNPLRDPRVRRAMSKAINRQGTVELVMEGLGSPAGQLLPEGFFGTSPSLHPDSYDPEGAKRLLAEAGWPDGFAITLHAPNNRYTNDGAVARTLGVALSRIGIATRVETMPAAEFFQRAAKLEFSVYMAGIASTLGETTDVLESLVATFDEGRNRGWINRMRYSNPDLDTLLDRAVATLDPKGRESMLRAASELAMADAAVLPLYFESKVWAMRREYSFTPRADEVTLAADVAPTRPSAAN